ncbi:conserved hypothetical protein [Hyella patelloides LEGE 07179]|uniref:Uncharacterized protein n=1 Tax=Hyella patelloides LEGE 07179 TaxID=945734 RepID=A0A563W413_9CYAN|nr:hypothetical protein [Hyella patelloides]VEP18377.1 conserved hypothetical protein [Hyella patelloides LEGE 07179]
MSTEIVAIAVGLVIAWLIFTWMVQILKASVSTAFTIGILLLILQIFFGINYEQILQEFNKIAQHFLS